MTLTGIKTFNAAERKKEQAERRIAKRKATQSRYFNDKFKKSKKYQDGLAALRQSYASNPEPKKKSRKTRYASNPDPEKVATKKRFASNPGPEKAARNKRYASNPGPEKVARNERYASNPEQSNEQSKIAYYGNRDNRRQQDQENANPNHVSQENDEISVDDVKTVENARQYDQRTALVGDKNQHQWPVCVLCDRFILGVEKICQINKITLQQHIGRIGVDSYQTYYGITLHPVLVKQYEVKNLPGLLLSTRARLCGDKFEACSTCMNSMKSSMVTKDSPPRHSIANGFVIGHIPNIIHTKTADGGTVYEPTVVNGDNLTDLVSSFLNPTRAFGYIFAYTAGAHRSIRGHYSFYEVNHNHVGGVLNHFLQTGANPHIYVVMCGRMTPKQREIARNKAALDTKFVIKLLTWYISESGHPGFADFTPPSECPKPTVIADPPNVHNTDDEDNPYVEHQFEGGTFHFSSGHEPEEDTGVFQSSQNFIVAMLQRTMPTLLVQGGDFSNLSEILLENIAVVQFPFGLGGPKMPRRNKVSPLECYRHYCRLSLPQFMRGDFLLVLNHMNSRLLSFQSAIIKCRSKILGKSLAERVSDMNINDLKQAALLKDNDKPVVGMGDASDFLHAVNTSCMPVGHSAQAAAKNRRLYFALDDYFGCGAIFLTISPCDECTFRLRLFANAGTSHKLPDLCDPSDSKGLSNCILDFNLRKKQRMQFPGASSLVYQHLMQIVTECLLGWDPTTQTGKIGIMGRLLAWARADEEQGRKTIHSHWQLWIESFNKCRDSIFSQDETTQKEARRRLLDYVDKVISATYGDEFVTSHDTCDTVVADEASTQDKVVDIPVLPLERRCGKSNIEECDKQTLRNARHKDHCFDIGGKVMKCSSCSESISTTEMINDALAHWRDISTNSMTNSSVHFTGIGPTTNTLTLKKEWLDLAAYKFPYDSPHFDTSPSSWTNHSLTRKTLLHLRFDEHSSYHRATCFKKGCECRANFPMPSCSESYIHIHDTIPNIIPPSKSSDKVPVPEKLMPVQCHSLFEDPVEKFQYMIIPKRHLGSQYLNQHSIPISEVLACNTNVSIGDPSHTYYSTLYSSKSTQDEDKMIYQRVAASVGRRILRALDIARRARLDASSNSMGIEAPLVEEQDCEGTDNQENEQDKEQNARQDCDDTSKGKEDTEKEKNEDYAEGLGRLLTGINAALSRDVVSSTMAHLLICQEGSRFSFSHKFSNLLLTQMEDVLDGKQVHFILRRNMGSDKKVMQWADSSADDYRYRGEELQSMCFYEFTMKVEKKFKTFAMMKKDDNNDNENDEESSTRIQFMEDHPGHHFSYQRRLKHPVIPKISMRKGVLCDIEQLQMNEDNPSQEVVRLREGYAKLANMLFIPFTELHELRDQVDDTYWTRFKNGHFGIVRPNEGRFWEKGKEILQNIQNRKTVEEKMRRPPDPLASGTFKPASTDKSKDSKSNDNSSKFDMDIDEFDYGIGEGSGVDGTIFSACDNSEMRTHAPMIKKGNIAKRHILGVTVNEDSLFDTGIGNSASNLENEDYTTNREWEHATTNENVLPSYDSILTFIQGSLVGCVGDDCTANHVNEVNSSIEPGKKAPTMREFASSSSNTQLDDKQYIAYEVICCSFLLQLVYEGVGSSALDGFLGATLNCNSISKKETLILKLKARGAQEQLIMFFSGPGGCGKSTSLFLAQEYCHAFCTALSVPFNDKTFFFTSTTGSSACLFGGVTIHGGAYLSKQAKITDDRRREWENVRILIIDEISFFKVSDMQELDKKLKRLTGRHDLPFGGISIVFSGDFHQMNPVCSSDDLLYSASPMSVWWENTINCAIVLETSHRFKDDPEYGEILARMRMGKDTREDREKINTRVIGTKNNVSLPSDPNACYATPFNAQRNAITAGVFRNHILATAPKVGCDDLPLTHTLMVEASMSRKDKKVSQTVHDIVVSQLGDNDVKSSEKMRGNTKVDPLLRLFPGGHFMCISNEDLKKGRGNGTICKCVKVRLKRRARLIWKNWEGRKVNTVSVDDLEWIMFEHWPKPPKNIPRTFKLTPKALTCIIQFPLAPDCETLKVALGNVKVTQIPVNSNIATTGHKLQGMTKDVLIVDSWSYSFSNWVYVVLSRVRTLSGLFLCKPLDLEKQFPVPEKLLQFEERMKVKEEIFLAERLSAMAKCG